MLIGSSIKIIQESQSQLDLNCNADPFWFSLRADFKSVNSNCNLMIFFLMFPFQDYNNIIEDILTSF